MVSNYFDKPFYKNTTPDLSTFFKLVDTQILANHLRYCANLFEL